jgi:hypothetical protein
MKRRQFITCFGATVAANTLTWSLAARAQQPAMRWSVSSAPHQQRLTRAMLLRFIKA